MEAVSQVFDHVFKALDEAPLERSYISRLSGVFNQTLSGKENLPDSIRAEGTFLFMRLHEPLTDKKPRMIPVVTFTDDAEKEAASIWSRFSPGAWAAVDSRSQAAANTALRGHYCDILWETKTVHGLSNPFRFAETAAGGYISWLDRMLADRNLWMDLKSVALRVAELGIQVERKDWVQAGFDRLVRALVAFEPQDKNRAGLVLGLGHAALAVAERAKKRKRALDLQGLRNVREAIERTAAKNTAHPLDGNVFRDAQALLGDLDQIEKGVLSKERQRSIADSYLRQAVFYQDTGNAVLASSFGFDAVKAFTALGDAAAAANAKALTREATKASLGQMASFMFKVTMPVDTVDRVLAALLEPRGWAEVFRNCSQSEDLIPDLQAEDAETDSTPLLAEIPCVAINGDRPIAHDPDGRTAIQVRARTMKVQNSICFFWLNLLDSALARGLQASDLLKVLSEGKVIPEDHDKAVGIGLGHYFSGDFLSACHVLIPQFEAALRHVLACKGADTTAFQAASGGRFRERPMSVFFDEKDAPQIAADAKASLGPLLWAWLKFVFVDERGMNLRNDVAHGLVPDERFGKVNAAIAVLAFVSLLAIAPSLSGSEVSPV